MHSERNGDSGQAGVRTNPNGDGKAPLNPLDERESAHNPDHERGVLGGLLLEPQQMADVLKILRADDFYSAHHREMFCVMEDLHRDAKSWDTTIIATELERRHQFDVFGGNHYLEQVANSVPSAVNTRQHAAYVKELADRRRLQETGDEIARGALSTSLTAAKLRERALGLLADIVPLGDGEPWPELCFQEPPEALPFPVDVFPIALRRFCEDAARVSLAPVDIAGCAMLATASAAVGQSVNLSLKRTWKESPLLYMLIVAEPGRTKSPVMKLVVKPLTKIDIRLRKESVEAHKRWEEAKRAYGKDPDKAPAPGPEPPQRRAIVKDITRETLVTILRDNPRGVLVNPDEATAWVASFNEYKAKGSDRQFWLDVWGSGPISVDREGGKRSLWVANPLASVMGGLPPDMLGTLSEQHGRNDGFIDRLLSSFPEIFPKQRWTTDELDEGDETTWFHVIQRLHDLPMHEDNGDVGPYFVYFEDDAQSAWVKFFDSHCEEMESENLPVSIIGVWSKLRAYAARFCLILSRLRLATNPECSDQQLHEAKVRMMDVQGAVKLVDYFKSHIARVQHRMTSGLGNQDAKIIVDWILRGDFAEFRERDLRSDLRRRFPTPESMSRALTALVRAGAIRAKLDDVDPHRKGRKSTPAYEVHPDLKTRRELHEIRTTAP